VGFLMWGERDPGDGRRCRQRLGRGFDGRSPRIGRFVRPAGGLQQFDEGAKISGREMTELFCAAIDDTFGHLLEEGVAIGRDRDPHNASVVGEALAADERPGLEPVDKAGDVRGSGDEPGGKDKRGECFWSRIPQQTQRVVLLGREIEISKHPLLERLEAIVGPPQVQIGLLLEGIKPVRLGSFAIPGSAACGGPHIRHIGMIVVST